MAALNVSSVVRASKPLNNNATKHQEICILYEAVLYEI